MSKRYSLLLYIAVILSSCNTSQAPIQKNLHHIEGSTFAQFDPDLAEHIVLEGYYIDNAYHVDSSVIFSAYNDGDIETSETPTNWGDRLVQMKGDTIVYESIPVGDPYQYEPNFFRNPKNGKIVIVCQLGNEDHYGGEAFILENENIKFIGTIEIENPYDLPNSNSLIDILQLTEHDSSIYFEFTSDTLTYLGNDQWEEVVNTGIYYKYTDQKFELIGL